MTSESKESKSTETNETEEDVVVLTKEDFIQPIMKRNLDELAMQQKEYQKDINGKLKTTSETKKRITFSFAHFTFSCVGAVIGSGILSLANGCKQMGLIGYIIWNILTILYYWYTSSYYSKAVYITGASTMGELFSLVFGKGFAAFVDICNTMFYFCLLCCDQVIATQYIFGIIQDLTTRDQWNNTLDECYGNPQRTAGISCYWHYILLFIVIICLNLPLIIPRSVKFLSKISVIIMIVAVFTAFSVMYKMIYHSVTNTSANNSDGNYPTVSGKLWPKSFMSFFTMAPFITANLLMKSHIPPLYSGTSGMSKKTKLISLQGGSWLAILLSTLLYVFIAIPGHIIFDNVSSNILNDFINSKSSTIDWHIFVCRVLMIAVVVIAYPLALLPACTGIVRYIPKEWKIVQINNGGTITLMVKLIILLGTTFVSCFVTNIGVIFSVGSSIFSILVCYIGPLSIIMFWPRIKKFGDPEFRKLSVIDVVLYNRKTKGKQYFENDEIMKAMETDEIQISKDCKKDNCDVVIEMKTNDCQEIELSEIKLESEMSFCVDEQHFENEDLICLQNKIVKLPDVYIPKWRYVLFITAMGCCVVLCILSVVGTLLGYN